MGSNPFDHLWDDSLGSGLQMALWDLAGKLADAPCHRLPGQSVREFGSALLQQMAELSIISGCRS